MDYVKKNDEILQKFRELEWNNPLEDTPQSIGEDGLLYRGKFQTLENGAIQRLPGNEEQMWNECKCRVMFITKDVNGETYDIRKDPARTPKVNQITTPFFKKMAYAVYGFHHIKDGKAPVFENLNNEECMDYYENAPIVRINCKKTAGKESISKGTFNKYTSKSHERCTLLVEQIRLWNPTIIVSCGSDTVYPFLHEHIFRKWENNKSAKGGSHYIYCPEENVIVINGTHPAATSAYEEYYEYLMSAIEDVIERYPEFRARVL